MQIAFNAKTGNLDYRPEEDDLQKIYKIAELTRMEGWQYLAEWWDIGREAIIEAGKRSIETKAGRERCPDKFSKLSGHDNCKNLATDLILKSQEIVDEMKNRQKSEGEPQ